MKKGIRLLAALSAALFLLGGCGTQLYELTEEEEDLIVQSAAYMLSKYNIYQQDGMNGALPPTEEENAAQEADHEQNAQENESAQGTDGSGNTDSAESSVQVISLAEAIGYADQLAVSYEGYSLMDVYQEGTYFSLSAESGKTFVVMRFSIHNQTDQELEINNFNAGYAFYCGFEGGIRVPEKESFITDSLASFEGKIAAGKTSGAVLIFEITKEQAELISEPELTMEQNGISYSVNL